MQNINPLHSYSYLIFAKKDICYVRFCLKQDIHDYGSDLFAPKQKNPLPSFGEWKKLDAYLDYLYHIRKEFINLTWPNLAQKNSFSKMWLIDQLYIKLGLQYIFFYF